MDAFLAKIETSAQRFVNPSSNHVKIPIKKSKKNRTFIRILMRRDVRNVILKQLYLRKSFDEENQYLRYLKYRYRTNGELLKNT